MKRILLSAVLTWLPFMVYTQVSSISQEGSTLQVRLFNDGDSEPNVEGSPYITEQFMPVVIKGINETYQARYNAAKDIMELKVKENHIVVLNNEVTPFTVQFVGIDKTYETVRLNTGKKGYLVLKWKSKDGHTLYEKEVIKYTPPQEALNGYQTSKPAQYTPDKSMIFFKDPSQERLIELSDREDVYNLWPSQDVGAYVKKEKLNVKKIDDLVKIFEYFYNKE